jgi:elongation factor G
MKDYKTEQLRNVVFLSHSSAGKTTFTESMLFASGAISRAGRVENGNTVTDFESEEIERQVSLNTGIVPVEWADHKINILDTPGTFDFIGEIRQAIRVADGALFLVDAVAGAEVGTELTWGYADEQNLPRLVVINKMDRENASFQRAMDSLNEQFDVNFVPLALPIGSQSNFAGVVDLVKMKAMTGIEGTEANIPADMADQVEEARMQLVEAAAESDDELIIKYLEGEELTEQEIVGGLRKSVTAGSVVPVLCASGLLGTGARLVIQAILNYLPAPAPSVTGIDPITEEEEELEANMAAPLSARV